MLELIRTSTHSVSTLDSLLLLHFTLVIPELEFASPDWNYITTAHAGKLEGIQRKFTALYLSSFL